MRTSSGASKRGGLKSTTATSPSSVSNNSLQHEGSRPVAPTDSAHAPCGRNLPAAILRAVQEGRKKMLPSRTAASRASRSNLRRDQRRRLAITDQSIVLDPGWHSPGSRNQVRIRATRSTGRLNAEAPEERPARVFEYQVVINPDLMSLGSQQFRRVGVDIARPTRCEYVHGDLPRAISPDTPRLRRIGSRRPRSRASPGTPGRPWPRRLPSGPDHSRSVRRTDSPESSRTPDVCCAVDVKGKSPLHQGGPGSVMRWRR